MPSASSLFSERLGARLTQLYLALSPHGVEHLFGPPRPAVQLVHRPLWVPTATPRPVGFSKFLTRFECFHRVPVLAPKYLEAHGVEVIEAIGDADYGVRGFVVADPDGNRIDVAQNL